MTVSSDLPFQELGLVRDLDGYESKGTCCENTWAVYRDLRLSTRARSANLASRTAASETHCRFGAPLIANALQQLGALDPQIDPASVTPALLPALSLQGHVRFGRPVVVRGL